MKDTTRAQIYQTMRTAKRWLRGADRVLNALYQAREGSKIDRGLAVASAAGVLAEAFFPSEDADDFLHDLGFERVETGLGGFLYTALCDAGLPYEEHEVGTSDKVRLWSLQADQRAAAFLVDQQGRPQAGPFVQPGCREALYKVVRELVWGGGQDLLVSAEGGGREGSRRRRDLVPYVVLPMEEPGVYFGEPGVDWYVNRLSQHESGTRSMLLVGPTGVGKSTLARLVSRQLAGGRTLKISGKAIRHCSLADVLDFVAVLAPTVLLLDDVNLVGDTDGGGSDRMLELMEALHGKARVVISTLMYEGSGMHFSSDCRPYAIPVDDKQNSGQDYFTGMRPGRIDEVVRVKRPSPRVREKILRHYLGDTRLSKKVLSDVVERTHGLTGAYLAEVAYRLRVHGDKTYKSEVASVIAACPKPVEQRRRGRRRRRLARMPRKPTAREKAMQRLQALQERGLSIDLDHEALAENGRYLHSAKALNEAIDTKLAEALASSAAAGHEAGEAAAS